MTFMTKRGIALNFLASFIFALLLFIPAIYVVSKILHLNEQGVDSFQDFSKKLESFAQDEKKSRAGMVLVLDEESAVLVYANTERIKAKENILITGNEFKELQKAFVFEHYLPYPPECGGFACTCLCRTFQELEVAPFATEKPTKIKIIDGVLVQEIVKKEISCLELRCEKLEEVFLQESWSHYRAKGESNRVVVNFVKEEGGIKIVS